jgi:ABC-type antimicrobial peptide transport system permease subunit
VRRIVAQGLALASLGAGIGIGLALALSRVTASLLYGVSTTDTVTFLAVPSALLLIALTACLIPARRAASLDPVCALRAE